MTSSIAFLPCGLAMEITTDSAVRGTYASRGRWTVGCESTGCLARSSVHVGRVRFPHGPPRALVPWPPSLPSFGGYSGATGALGRKAGSEADLDRRQVGAVAELQDRADDPVDLLWGDGQQWHQPDHEQVAVLVEREAQDVAGRLPQQQVAEQAPVLLLGRAHEERLDPERPVPHLEVHADPELALTRQHQESAALIEPLGLQAGLGEERLDRGERGRPHRIGLR